jgi:KipI family sensor histidine kinase inhibitor
MLLPAGDDAVLVEVDSVDDVLALTAALRAAELPEVVDLVPAARTVLALSGVGRLDALLAAVSRIAADTEPGDDAAVEQREVSIHVRYDGADLDDVTRLTGLSRAAIIAKHTGTPWRAAFIGFAPGFAYLTGGPAELAVPRRAESRTSVPAGAVALAGGYSAVYPAASPGGWQLIGSTDASLWDLDRDPPSLIRPGDLVRFVDVDDR